LKRFFQRFLLYRIIRKIENYNLKKASIIAAVSEPLRQDLISAGVDDKKIIVNPNGYDSKRFRHSIAYSDISRNIREKIGNEKVIIGFCGTFGPWHGIPQLEEAIYRIIESNVINNFHFLIIGDGGELKKNMERKLSGYDNLSFVGNIEYSKVHDYLAICDILVSPHNPPADSREFFGSPTKIFEYMGMGKAIVASDLGQIVKILRDKETAILVPPGDVDKLIDAIVLLARNPELRSRLGDNASKEAPRYSWDKNIERLLAIVKEKEILK